MGIDKRGEYVEIPAHPPQLKKEKRIFEAEQEKKYGTLLEQMLETKMTRAQFFTFVALCAVGGIKLADMIGATIAYTEACDITDLRNGDIVTFIGQGARGWNDKDAPILVGPSEGKGVIKPEFGGTPLAINKRLNGEDVVMVRVVYGKDELGFDKASWHEAPTLTKIEPVQPEAGK
jgi:hypothetical protein